MAFPRVVTRTAATALALPALLAACSPAANTPQAAPKPAATAASAAPAAPAVAPLANQFPAAPAPESSTCDVAAMPLREKLAQLLMVGVRNGADAQAVVANHHVGGIFIGSWTDQSIFTDRLLPGISAAAGPIALAVSVDEEGGRVQRLSGLIGSNQPSPRVLAQTMTSAQVHDIAFERGQKMRDLGITVDFAPVADVTNESDDEVIGDRSFGSDPAKVTEYAGAYAQGLRDAGLLPVLKHFPGHGHASGDSHTGGVTTPPLASLMDDDLVPYRTLTTAGRVAVMVGHMQVPGLTSSDPASLSPAAYDLLRSGDYGGPGFGGLVFTDDLSSMGAINQRYDVPDAVLKALQAGADVALWVSTGEVPAVLDRLEQAVNGGELSPQKVDASVQKLAEAKGTNPHC
jgi:beta-N-acetylhexosaminidase